MAKNTIGINSNNQIDEFVQEIQKCKMRELWGNKIDDIYDEFY